MWQGVVLKVETLAKDEVASYSMIKAYLQLLDLPSWFDHQSQDDKLNLNLRECPMIETLMSRIWM